MTDKQRKEVMNLDRQDMENELQRMMETMYQNEKNQKREQYRRLNRFVKKGQVLFVGSSLMEQFPVNELMLDYDVDTIIYNRGIGGFVMDELEAALQECVLDLEPSKIFINIGTNDLSNPECSLDALMKKYDRILDKIKMCLPRVRIYMMAYYPINIEAATAPRMIEVLKIRTNERILAANEKVKALAEKRGHKYIDVNRNLYDEKGQLKAEYTKEGMHFYGDGYEAIFHDLMKYVEEE